MDSQGTPLPNQLILLKHPWKFMKIHLVKTVFFDHNTIKLEIYNKQRKVYAPKNAKHASKWLTEEIIMKIIKTEDEENRT